MPTPHVQFLGPTLRPIRKWVFGLAILGILALLIAFGLFRAFPLWLQMAGWAFIGILHCVSDIPTGRHRKQRRLTVYSTVIPRWLGDQPCDKPKP
jgi:hypothetical protein